MIRFSIVILLFSLSCFARTIYIMPDDGVLAEKDLIRSIENSKQEIVATIYTFTNNSIAKAFKKAAKKGVKITIVVDEKSLKSNLDYSKAGELAKIKNIYVKTTSGKKSKDGTYSGIMHLKIMIIDKEKVIYGSANWSNSAFNINYEIITIENNKNFANELLKRLDPMIKNAKDY